MQVNEHAIDLLELTPDLLSHPAKDFASWNERAGRRKTPKVAAIVMEMVGSKSQIRSMPDRTSQMFLERAIEIAENYPDLFGRDDPADTFVISGDFVSVRRIRDAKASQPRLKINSFPMVEGKRLRMNPSASRYHCDLTCLA